MDAREIIADANRRNEILELQLQQRQHQLDAAGSEIRTLNQQLEEGRSKITSMKRRNEVLELCLEDGESNTRFAGVEITSLAQQLDEARWHLTNAGGENRALRGDLDMMQTQIADMHRHLSGMAGELDTARAEINNRGNYITALQRHIAYMENSSAEGMAASRKALEQAEAFYKGQLASITNSNAHWNTHAMQLSQNVAGLQHAVREATNRHDITQANIMHQLIMAQYEMLAGKQRRDQLGRKLEQSKGNYQALQQASVKLTSHRDALSRELAKSRAALQNNVDKNKKAQEKERQELGRKTAEVEARAAEEIKRLEMQIQTKEAEAKEQRALQARLEKGISAEDGLQEEYQRTLEKAESLQEQVESLQGQVRESTGFSQIISDQEVQITKLLDRLDEHGAEAERKQRDAARLQDEVWALEATLSALRREHARLKGVSHGETRAMLEALGRNRHRLYLHILDSLLDRLDGAGITRDANLAVEAADAFLADIEGRITDYLHQAVADGAAFSSLIKVLQGAIPVQADKGSLEDAKRMAGDVVVLKSVVHSLRVQTKRDLGGRDGCKVLGFLKPAELLFGVSPDRSVALPKQSHIMRTTFLLVSANMALSVFTEWANFYKACVCMFVFYFGQLWANRIEDALRSKITQPVNQEAPASLSGRGPDGQQVPMFRGKGRRLRDKTARVT